MGRKIVGAKKIAISLHKNLVDVEKDWVFLQKNGLCTLYQTFEWCKAWQDTAGNARRIEPLIIRGSSGPGKPVFILPFAVVTTMGARALKWYGAAEITYGMGIFDRGYLTGNPNFLEALWPEIVDLLGNVDSIQLDNQPEKWDGFDNPLKFLFTSRGANQSYKMALQPDFQTLYESKRSSSTRRSARSRDKKLQDVGKVTFSLPEMGSETYDVINTMINQQQDRLGQKGIRSVYDETRRAFLQQLAKSTWQDGTRVLLPYNLSVDGKACAVTLGGAFQSTYWALILSLTPDKKLHPFSPGDRALRATIQASCERGFDTFDFSAGDSEYKRHWSDEEVNLFESNKAATVKGAVVATLASVVTGVKRFVKQTPWLFSIVLSVRKALLKKKP